MKSRKLFFIALALALPLALIVPLRAARSWQPRTVELPTSVQISGDGGRSGDFFWRASGMLLTNANGNLPARVATNWNGGRVPIRVMPGARAEVDRAGELAIYAWPRGGRSGDVVAWDVPGERVMNTLVAQMARDNREHRLTFGPRTLALSPDGTRAAWNGLAPDDIVIADARTGRVSARLDLYSKFRQFDSAQRKLRSLAPVSALIFSADGKELAVVGDNTVRIVDAQTGQVRRSWSVPANAAVSRARWSPDGRYLALFDGSGAHEIMYAQINGVARTRKFLTICDARDGREVRSWSQTYRDDGEDYGVTNAAFSPDGARVAWGTFRGPALSMELASGAIERRFAVAPAPPASFVSGPVRRYPDNSSYVAYAPDGQTLAVAAPDKIVLWRVR